MKIPVSAGMAVGVVGLAVFLLEAAVPAEDQVVLLSSGAPPAVAPIDAAVNPKVQHRKELTEAHAAYRNAVRQHGRKSPEAKAALERLNAERAASGLTRPQKKGAPAAH